MGVFRRNVVTNRAKTLIEEELERKRRNQEQILRQERPVNPMDRFRRSEARRMPVPQDRPSVADQLLTMAQIPTPRPQGPLRGQEVRPIPLPEPPSIEVVDTEMLRTLVRPTTVIEPQGRVVRRTVAPKAIDIAGRQDFVPVDTGAEIKPVPREKVVSAGFIDTINEWLDNFIHGPKRREEERFAAQAATRPDDETVYTEYMKTFYPERDPKDTEGLGFKTWLTPEKAWDDVIRYKEVKAAPPPDNTGNLIFRMLQRFSAAGAEALTGTKSRKVAVPSTGNQTLDYMSDFIGFLGSFAVPTGIPGMAIDIGGTVSRAVAPRMARIFGKDYTKIPAKFNVPPDLLEKAIRAGTAHGLIGLGHTDSPETAAKRAAAGAVGGAASYFAPFQVQTLAKIFGKSNTPIERIATGMHSTGTFFATTSVALGVGEGKPAKDLAVEAAQSYMLGSLMGAITSGYSEARFMVNNRNLNMRQIYEQMLQFENSLTYRRIYDAKTRKPLVGEYVSTFETPGVSPDRFSVLVNIKGKTYPLSEIAQRSYLGRMYSTFVMRPAGFKPVAGEGYIDATVVTPKPGMGGAARRPTDLRLLPVGRHRGEVPPAGTGPLPDTGIRELPLAVGGGRAFIGPVDIPPRPGDIIRNVDGSYTTPKGEIAFREIKDFLDRIGSDIDKVDTLIEFGEPKEYLKEITDVQLSDNAVLYEQDANRMQTLDDKYRYSKTPAGDWALVRIDADVPQELLRLPDDSARNVALAEAYIRKVEAQAKKKDIPAVTREEIKAEIERAAPPPPIEDYTSARVNALKPGFMSPHGAVGSYHYGSGYVYRADGSALSARITTAANEGKINLYKPENINQARQLHLLLEVVNSYAYGHLEKLVQVGADGVTKLDKAAMIAKQLFGMDVDKYRQMLMELSGYTTSVSELNEISAIETAIEQPYVSMPSELFMRSLGYDGIAVDHIPEATRISNVVYSALAEPHEMTLNEYRIKQYQMLQEDVFRRMRPQSIVLPTTDKLFTKNHHDHIKKALDAGKYVPYEVMKNDYKAILDTIKPERMDLETFRGELQRYEQITAAVEAEMDLTGPTPGVGFPKDYKTWQEFSVARGYTQDNITDFERWMQLNGKGIGEDRKFDYTELTAENLWRQHIEYAMMKGEKLPTHIKDQYLWLLRSSKAKPETEVLPNVDPAQREYENYLEEVVSGHAEFIQTFAGVPAPLNRARDGLRITRRENLNEELRALTDLSKIFNLDLAFIDLHPGYRFYQAAYIGIAPQHGIIRPIVLFNVHADARPGQYAHIYFHEIYHDITKTTPQAATEFDRLLQSKLNYTQGDVQEEQHAEVLGNLFTLPEIWDALRPVMDPLIWDNLKKYATPYPIKSHLNRLPASAYSELVDVAKDMVTQYYAIAAARDAYLLDITKEYETLQGVATAETIRGVAENIKFQKIKYDDFYYKAELSAENMGGDRGKLPAAEAIKYFTSQKQGIREKELAELGLIEWLNTFPPKKLVSKEEVIDHINNNKLAVIAHPLDPKDYDGMLPYEGIREEGDIPGTYGVYVIRFAPGGKYAHPSHHSYPENTIGNFRYQLFRDENNKTIMHGTEFQSDWAIAHRNAERQRGLATEDSNKRYIELVEMNNIRPELELVDIGGATHQRDITVYPGDPRIVQKAVDEMPWIKNSHELLVRKAIQFAAQMGYDGVTFASGLQVSKLWGMGTWYNKIILRLNERRRYEADIPKHISEVINAAEFGDMCTALDLYIGVGGRLVDANRRPVKVKGGDLNYEDDTLYMPAGYTSGEVAAPVLLMNNYVESWQNKDFRKIMIDVYKKYDKELAKLRAEYRKIDPDNDYEIKEFLYNQRVDRENERQALLTAATMLGRYRVRLQENVNTVISANREDTEDIQRVLRKYFGIRSALETKRVTNFNVSYTGKDLKKEDIIRLKRDLTRSEDKLENKDITEILEAMIFVDGETVTAKHIEDFAHLYFANQYIDRMADSPRIEVFKRIFGNDIEIGYDVVPIRDYTKEEIDELHGYLKILVGREVGDAYADALISNLGDGLGTAVLEGEGMWTDDKFANVLYDTMIKKAVKQELKKHGVEPTRIKLPSMKYPRDQRIKRPFNYDDVQLTYTHDWNTIDEVLPVYRKAIAKLLKENVLSQDVYDKLTEGRALEVTYRIKQHLPPEEMLTTLRTVVYGKIAEELNKTDKLSGLTVEDKLTNAYFNALNSVVQKGVFADTGEILEVMKPLEGETKVKFAYATPTVLRTEPTDSFGFYITDSMKGPIPLFKKSEPLKKVPTMSKQAKDRILAETKRLQGKMNVPENVLALRDLYASQDKLGTIINYLEGTGRFEEDIIRSLKKYANRDSEQLTHKEYQNALHGIDSYINDMIYNYTKNQVGQLKNDPNLKNTLRAAKDYKFEPDIEKRWQAADGINKPTRIENSIGVVQNAIDLFSRSHEHLPNIGYYFPLRNELISLKKSPQVAGEETAIILKEMVGDLKKERALYNLFTRKVILDSMGEDYVRYRQHLTDKGLLEEDQPFQWRFGFNKESFAREYKSLKEMIDANPLVANQMRIRKLMWEKLIPRYVAAMESIGHQVESKFTRQHYYHMQVLDYHQLKEIEFTKNRAKVPRYRGWLKKRLVEGSEKDFNVNFLESEFEVISQMLKDIHVASVLGVINKKYNMYGEFALEAAALNEGMPEDQHVSVRDLMKERISPAGNKLVEFYPDEKNMFFLAHTVPDRIVDKLYSGLMKEMKITEADIGRVLAVAGRKPMILDENIAKTLEEINAMDKLSPNVVQFSEDLLRYWRMWHLISPPRYVKYNMRNFATDVEIVLAKNPGTLKRIPKGTIDLFKHMFLKQTTYEDTQTIDIRGENQLWSWVRRGGLQSLLQAQDMGAINHFADFAKLNRKHGGLHKIPENLIVKYWRGARLSTDFREAILRYATYLDYQDQMLRNIDPRYVDKAGNIAPGHLHEAAPDNFGGSIAEEIMNLSNIKDRAYWLSNELLGAYDRIGVAGEAIAKYAVPFWRFQEINAKRKKRLISNVVNDPEILEQLGRGIINKISAVNGEAGVTPKSWIAETAKWSITKTPLMAMRLGTLFIRLFGLWGATQLYNNIRFPDHQYSIPEYDRRNFYVILDKTEDGYLYFNRLGFSSDIFDWIGDTPWGYVNDFLKGRKTFLEIAEEVAISPLKKVMSSLTPFISIPYEGVTGMGLFPDPADPRNIRDFYHHLARGYGIEGVYTRMKGLPRRKWGEELMRIFAYKQLEGQGSYFDIMEEVTAFVESKGYPQGRWYGEHKPKSTALFYMRQAMVFGDKEAFEKYMIEYRALGGEAKDFDTSLRNLHPLHRIKDEYEDEFINQWLDDDGRERLKRAMEYYELVAIGSPDFRMEGQKIDQWVQEKKREDQVTRLPGRIIQDDRSRELEKHMQPGSGKYRLEDYMK